MTHNARHSHALSGLLWSVAVLAIAYRHRLPWTWNALALGASAIMATMRSPAMRKLVAVDEAAVVADYEADVLVDAICASHDIGH